jgi:hypothetical protein
MERQISNKFNGAKVGDVVVDKEFGNVTATVNGKKNTCCGFIEDYTCPDWRTNGKINKIWNDLIND